MEPWKGYKRAVVWKEVVENEFIDTFYLKLEQDEGPLPDYKPGQFIAIKVPREDGTYSKTRQYTLSTISNGEYYRISVKREQDGDVSKILCDELKEGDIVEISPPVGKFVLDETEAPLVLIGGGIGITPMLAMAMEAAKTKRNTHFIYSVPNSKLMAFSGEIEALKEENPNFKSTIAFTRPLPEDALVKDFQYQGRLSQEWFARHVDYSAEFYFCGPVEFMRMIYHSLKAMEIPEERIHYETFTVGVDIRN